jgi:hypothetical protein
MTSLDLATPKLDFFEKEKAAGEKDDAADRAIDPK